ncbi:MAG: hypothetical protein KDE51_08110 [Anaerolineales bacterium]|nr:hypothetical protein [Anaerolineales bacterium]
MAPTTAVASAVVWREFKNEQFTIDYPAAWEVTRTASETRFTAVEQDISIRIQAGEAEDWGNPSIEEIAGSLSADGQRFFRATAAPTDYPDVIWLVTFPEETAPSNQALIIFHEDKIAVIQATFPYEQEPLIKEMLGRFRFLVAGTL